jgi:hypothetical protein
MSRAHSPVKRPLKVIEVGVTKNPGCSGRLRDEERHPLEGAGAEVQDLEQARSGWARRRGREFAPARGQARR